jgi:hypothetical protein
MRKICHFSSKEGIRDPFFNIFPVNPMENASIHLGRENMYPFRCTQAPLWPEAAKMEHSNILGKFQTKGID